MNNNTYELYHFGILGMKWGIRRFQNEDGTLTPAGKIRYRNDDGSYTEAGKQKASKGKNYDSDYWKSHDKKKVEYMSDKELQQRIMRLNNEKQYKQLTKSKKQKAADETLKIGKKFIDVAVVGVAVGYAAKKTSPYINKYMDKGFDFVKKAIAR